MVNTLELQDALTMNSAEMICAVHTRIRRQHPVCYTEYGPGALFGSGHDTNIASAFGFETPEDETSFNEVTSRILRAIEVLELSGLVIVQKTHVRERTDDRKITPAASDVEVSVDE